MRTTARVAAGLTAVAVLGVGAVVLAGPTIAGGNAAAPGPAVSASPTPGQGYGPGPGPGTGPGMGQGMGARMGQGMSPGMGPGMGVVPGSGAGPGPGAGPGRGTAGGPGSCLADVASGTLTTAQKATLASMAEEEKLAGDLYAAFGAKYPDAVFDRIAASEDQHLAAVRTLLARYDLADPTKGKAAGEFASATVQATYDRLLARGLTGRSAALEAAQQVERADITALTSALSGLTAPDVRQVYTHLLAASRHHLAAFTTWSTG